MPRKRPIPEGAIERKCPVCNKCFKPMTDAQYRENYARHLALSIRHRKYARLAALAS